MPEVSRHNDPTSRRGGDDLEDDFIEQVEVKNVKINASTKSKSKSGVIGKDEKNNELKSKKAKQGPKIVNFLGWNLKGKFWKYLLYLSRLIFTRAIVLMHRSIQFWLLRSYNVAEHAQFFIITYFIWKSRSFLIIYLLWKLCNWITF